MGQLAGARQPTSHSAIDALDEKAAMKANTLRRVSIIRDAQQVWTAEADANIKKTHWHPPRGPSVQYLTLRRLLSFSPALPADVTSVRVVKARHGLLTAALQSKCTSYLRHPNGTADPCRRH